MENANVFCGVQNYIFQSGFRDDVFRMSACFKSDKYLSFWNTYKLLYLDLDWIHVKSLELATHN